VGSWTVSLAALREHLNVSISNGEADNHMPFGVPTPCGYPMMLARGQHLLQNWADYATDLMTKEGESKRTCKTEDVESKEVIVDMSQWTVHPRRMFVVQRLNTETKKVSYTVERTAPLWNERIRFIVHTGAARLHSISVEAEVTAQAALFKRLDEDQRDCYILNNMFIERSKRSRCVYILRKGLPTIAMSIHDNGYHFLAAMCMHPLGYFNRTYCGVMAPSDEILTHLLMIRSDEHMYWRKCNQHQAWEPESGI